MTTSNIVVYALYAWLAVSVLAVIVQFLRRRQHKQNEQKASVAAAKRSVTRTAMTPVTQAPKTQDAQTQAPRRPPPATPATPATQIQVEPAAEVVPTPIDAVVVSTVPSSAPTVAASISGSAPRADAEHDTGSTDLAELLAGIKLPCDLLPTVPVGVEPSDDRVSLITSSATSDEVGPAFADELERLGYILEPTSASQLLATRSTDRLTLTMVLDPAVVTHDDTRAFPDAVDGDVVVTITAGAHPE